MKIGVLSDTHGHHQRAINALELLRANKVEELIHCGDVGSDLVLDLLLEQQESGIPVTVVPGNVDEWDPGIMLYARKLGFSFHRVARRPIGDTQLAVFHGHDPKQMDALLSEPDLDLLLTGHSHVARDEQVGSVRVINPGAVFRASVPSVAVLDIGQQIDLQIVQLG